MKQEIRDKLIEHREYISTCGDDLPEIRDWKVAARVTDAFGGRRRAAAAVGPGICRTSTDTVRTKA